MSLLLLLRPKYGDTHDGEGIVYFNEAEYRKHFPEVTVSPFAGMSAQNLAMANRLLEDGHDIEDILLLFMMIER